MFVADRQEVRDELHRVFGFRLLGRVKVGSCAGIELIRQIRKNPAYATLPILMLTTESQAAKKDEAKAAGATGWIVKPFVQDKLLAVVKKVIR